MDICINKRKAEGLALQAPYVLVWKVDEELVHEDSGCDHSSLQAGTWVFDIIGKTADADSAGESDHHYEYGTKVL